MDNKSLIEYILEGRQHKSELALAYWFDNSKRYYEFVDLHRDKIRSKFRKSITDEDIADVLFELELPYLFLINDRFMVEYEKYGSGKKRAPDFTIQYERNEAFNVEVKRIREGSFGTRYSAIINKIIDPVRKTPSSLGFSINVRHFDLDENFIIALENSAEQITSQIQNLISREETKMSYDSAFDYPLPGFENEIEITLSRPSGKKNSSKTSYYGGLSPIFYTNKEPLKFGDTVLEKLGQCISGMINILFISTNSSTHEPDDVLESIASINSLIRTKNNDFFKNKGFAGIDDFVDSSRNLSGIVVKTTWASLKHQSNLVWCNSNAAHQIPLDLKDYMKYMGTNMRVHSDAHGGA